MNYCYIFSNGPEISIQYSTEIVFYCKAFHTVLPILETLKL
jgi:hypothetical protein